MSSTSRPQRRKRFVTASKDFRDVDPMRGPRFNRAEDRNNLLTIRRDVTQTIDLESYLDEELS